MFAGRVALGYAPFRGEQRAVAVEFDNADGGNSCKVVFGSKRSVI